MECTLVPALFTYVASNKHHGGIQLVKAEVAHGIVGTPEKSFTNIHNTGNSQPVTHKQEAIMFSNAQ